MSDTTSATSSPQRRSGRPGERRNAAQRFGLWYRQIVAELRKVIWPTRKELIAYTIVTLVFAVVMILIVAGLDYGAHWGVLKIFG